MYKIEVEYSVSDSGACVARLDAREKDPGLSDYILWPREAEERRDYTAITGENWQDVHSLVSEVIDDARTLVEGWRNFIASTPKTKVFVI